MVCLFCGKRNEIDVLTDEFENQGAVHFIFDCHEGRRLSDDKKTIICNCGFRTDVKMDLFNHMVMQHTHLEIKCTLCDQQFSVPDFINNAFEKHCLEHHTTEQK